MQHLELAAFIGSDDSWSALIGGAIAVAGVGATVWAALYAVNPRRGMTWEVTRNAALLGTSRVPSDVSVTHAGAALRSPHLVDIRISNIGRRDIESSMFSNGNNSLIFDFTARVVAVVDSTSEPSTGGIGETSHNGPELHVHPFLIARKQAITYSVLVDGTTFRRGAQCTRAEIAHNPIYDAYELRGKRKNRIYILRVVSVAVVVIGIVTSLMYNSFKMTRLPKHPVDAQECIRLHEESPDFFKAYCEIKPKDRAKDPVRTAHPTQ